MILKLIFKKEGAPSYKEVERLIQSSPFIKEGKRVLDDESEPEKISSVKESLKAAIQNNFGEVLSSCEFEQEDNIKHNIEELKEYIIYRID